MSHLQTPLDTHTNESCHKISIQKHQHSTTTTAQYWSMSCRTSEWVVSLLWTPMDQISILHHQHSIRLLHSNKVCHGTRANGSCGICEHLLSRVWTGFLFKCTNILLRLRRNNKVHDQPPPSSPVTCEKCFAVCGNALQCVAMCCNVLQSVVVCCSALQCVAVRCIALHCVAVSCSVLQCFTLCYLPVVLQGVNDSLKCVTSHARMHTHTHTHACARTRTRFCWKWALNIGLFYAKDLTCNWAY